MLAQITDLQYVSAPLCPCALMSLSPYVHEPYVCALMPVLFCLRPCVGFRPLAAAKVCTDLAEQGVAIPTPTQFGVWRSVIRSGEKEKENIKKVLQTKKTSAFILMQKKLCGIEYQVVCLNSGNREIKLGELKCKSESAQNIFNELEHLQTNFLLGLTSK